MQEKKVNGIKPRYCKPLDRKQIQYLMNADYNESDIFMRYWRADPELIDPILRPAFLRLLDAREDWKRALNEARTTTQENASTAEDRVEGEMGASDKEDPDRYEAQIKKYLKTIKWTGQWDHIHKFDECEKIELELHQAQELFASELKEQG